MMDYDNDYDNMSVSDLLGVYIRIGRDAGSNGLHQVPSSEELDRLELALRKAVIREEKEMKLMEVGKIDYDKMNVDELLGEQYKTRRK